MARPKGQPKLGGRQKGTPNKLSSDAKEHIHAVFVRLGGVTAMAKWAQENQSDFYRIYSKLLPIDAAVTGNVTLAVAVVVPPKSEG